MEHSFRIFLIKTFTTSLLNSSQIPLVLKRCNSAKKPVKNRDLWEPLIESYLERDNISFEWVKGHSGDIWNDEADRLAVQAGLEQISLKGDLSF